MTLIQIWHHPEGDVLDLDPRPFPGAHWRHVMDLTVEALDTTGQLARAFELSNHTMDEDEPVTRWTQRPQVTCLHGKDARSTSVGDVLVVGAQAWHVEPVSFRLLTP